MIRLRPSGADEVLIKRVRDWYEPGPGVFIASTAGQTASFTPALLFTGSTTGVWYDPSDFTTLFQDAAGTLPVTAVEQPVGLMKDKSGRNNHAFNSSGNSANFPVLSARYNLLTKTEQFDDAVWQKASVTVTADATTSPTGTLTADRITLASGTAAKAVYSDIGVGAAAKQRISVKIETGVRYFQLLQNVNSDVFANFDVLGGITGSKGSAVSSSSITSNGDGWYTLELQTTSSNGSGLWLYIVDSAIATYSSATSSTGSFFIWGADLRVANDAMNQPAYQRVNTATDYDTVGFKPYLRFNGANQWLQTNSIDFTYGDKMFVSAGVRKLSDAAFGIIAEISPVVDLNNGAMVIGASIGGAQRWVSALRGTSLAYYEPATYAAPDTNVLATSFDIAGAGISSEIVPRVNGVIEQDNPFGASAGTGNFGNYPLYIGARGGSSSWFNGRLYQMVVAGKQASASEITNTETFINQKTGAY